VDAHSTLCGKKARRGVVGVDDNGVGVQQDANKRMVEGFYPLVLTNG
jgi:hypothetical protein